MNRLSFFLTIMLFLPSILLLQVMLTGSPELKQLVNAHESIEQLTDVAKLQTTMEELGITKTILHGIPSDFLRYNPDKAIDIGDVGENHEYLFQTTETFPAEFDFFCAIDPSDPRREEVWADCDENGAVGVKFYGGYSYSYEIPLDDPSLYKFYTLLEDAEVPLMMPVNTSLYQDELERVLENHPDLDVICSHYCSSSKDLDRLDALLTAHDNLYFDTSWGHKSFVEEGLLTITANHESFHDFFIKHQDRAIFGTDNIVTSYEGKNVKFLVSLYSDYIAMLTEANLFPSAIDEQTLYRGLGLPYSVKRKVFWQNAEDLLK
ncbi:amidohydrolase family protein [Candidatus Peregrinibacteria bacterium]|nr:amidohydrolase family protein [Candidatus Peregrinibacteria bacterium]